MSEPIKKFATIWRIETDSGTGMYGWGAYERIFIDDIFSSTNGGGHPPPDYDDQLGWNKMGFDESRHYHFGFASLAQMRQWVYLPKWRRALAKHGLVLRKYRVPAEFFRRSPFQAIFQLRFAECVETRRPDYAD